MGAEHRERALSEFSVLSSVLWPPLLVMMLGWSPPSLLGGEVTDSP